jgi:hypothetical protein
MSNSQPKTLQDALSTTAIGNLAVNLGQIGLGVVDSIGDLEKSAPLVSRPEIARE